MNPTTFAKNWEDDWNSQDLDRIMSHYREDVVFRSRKAVPLLGDAQVAGKASLRAYWNAALARQPDLHFEVLDVFAGHSMVVITYRNQRGKLAAETLCFDDDGKVYMAAACHRDD